MVRQWYDFFAQDRGVEDKRILFTKRLFQTKFSLWHGLLLFVLLTVQFEVHAESPTPLEPTFELEQIITGQGKGPARVGDKLEFRVKDIHLPSVKNLSQDLKISEPESATTLADSGWDLQESKGSVKLSADEFRFLALPLKPGQLTLPSLILKNQAGLEVARTRPLIVEISSAISAQDPQPDQPVDIEPPVGLKFPILYLIAIGLLVSFLVVGFGVGLWRWWAKTKLRKIQPKVDNRTEDEIALFELDLLDQKNYLSQGAFKQHYFRVSEVLKAYIGSRYRFEALESTTREMLAVLTAQNEIESTQLVNLRRLFHQLDLVKFTDFRPESVDAALILNQARDFIIGTRRIKLIAGVDPSTSTEEVANHAVR